MENKFRNEMSIELGSEKVLLRPTFENLAAMESKMGSIAGLAFKYAKDVNIEDAQNIDARVLAKTLPPFTDCSQIIYFNQAEKTYTLEEIHTMVMDEGIKVCAQVVLFLVRCTAGNKFAGKTSQKKSSSQKKES